MITVSTPTTLRKLREEARDLLNEFDAADGLASYYALHHDPKRTTLVLHDDASGAADGFLARCQTGFDLFRPVVALRVRGANDPVPALVEAGLVAGRPYVVVVPEPLLARLGEVVTLTNLTRNHILRLDAARFKPEMNVLVVSRADREGNPRAEIRRGPDVVAMAGVNWRSPIFAEVFVNVDAEARGHGWGRSVVRAVVADLLKQGVTPLYSVAEDNDPSYDLALDVGFVDTAAREIVAHAVRA
jgi:ribosomal protein S18 acetylase RimI-like enzyme